MEYESSKKTSKKQTRTSAASSVTQCVLTNPADAGRNAQLTREYHQHENNGDAYSPLSRKVEDHQAAIDEYKEAKRKRRQAARLHTNMDGGHLTAISTLDDKIIARRSKIAELTPRQEQAPRVREERRKPDWFSPSGIGSANQASWITGKSAWVPRK